MLVLVNLYVFLWRGGTSIPDVMEQAAVAGSMHPSSPLVEGPVDEPNPGDPAEVPGPEDERAPDPDEQINWVEGEVQAGDSLVRILERHGIDSQAAEEIISALREHMDMRSIRVGQKYRIRLDDTGVVMEFQFHLSRVQTALVERQDDGSLTGKKVDAETRLEEVELGGSIDSSLYMSIKESGEDTALVGFFVDVFAYDLNFYIDTHAGDTYRMIVEKEYLGDEFLRYRRVLAAEYSGKAGTYRAFYWTPPGSDKGRYYNDRGESVEKTFLKTPLKYARISSGFNPKRMHPILHVRRGHYGVDYAAPTGTPIWAAASGIITFRGRKGGAGNCVIIKHDNGLQTTYMHLSKFRSGQSVGSRVRQKDVIGYVGMTGLATGPHLHFSVRKSGRYIDPLKMKMARSEGVKKKDKPAFEAHISPWIDRLAVVDTTGGPSSDSFWSNKQR